MDKKIFSIEQFLNKQNGCLYSNSNLNTVIRRTGYPKTFMIFAGLLPMERFPLSSFSKTSRSAETTIRIVSRVKSCPGFKGTLETDNGVSNRTELQLTNITPCKHGASRVSRNSSTSTSDLHYLQTLIHSITLSEVFWSHRYVPDLTVN